METFESNGWRFRIRETRNRQGETIKTVIVVATQASLTVGDLAQAVNELSQHMEVNQAIEVQGGTN